MRAFQAGEPIRAKVTVPSAAEALQLVSRGLGIGVLPAALIGPQAPAIATVALADDWARRRLLLCWRPGLAAPVALSLAEALRAALKATTTPDTTGPAVPALPR